MARNSAEDGKIINAGGDGHGRTRVSRFDKTMDEFVDNVVASAGEMVPFGYKIPGLKGPIKRRAQRDFDRYAETFAAEYPHLGHDDMAGSYESAKKREGLFMQAAMMPGMMGTVAPRIGSNGVLGSRWYSDMVNRYGVKNAETARALLGTDRYAKFIAPEGMEKAAADAAQYATVRGIERALGGDPSKGGAVIGGSMSINKTGTLNRKTAVAHDLDIASNIDGASLRPWEPYPFYLAADDTGVVGSWYDKYMSPIEGWWDKPGTRDAGILRRIREKFPETHANAKVVPWDWKTMRLGSPEDRYKPGVFQQIGNGYSLSPEAGNNLFLGTKIHGVPVDIFLTDSRIERTPGSNYAPPEVAMSWKNAYARENEANGGGMRPKDAVDFRDYRRFSEANPVVDPVTRKAQFSPPNFGDTILTEEGYPAIHDVETWPNSGTRIPMIMNAKGEMAYPFDPNALRQDAKGGDARAASKGSEEPRESTAPTDDQIAEALEFLEMFRENEEPENEFEANAIERLYNLVSATYEKAIKNRPIEPVEEPPVGEQPVGEQPVADDKGGETKDKPDPNNFAASADALETEEGAPETDGQTQDLNGDGSVVDHGADAEQALAAESGLPDASEPDRNGDGSIIDHNADYERFKAEEQAQQPAQAQQPMQFNGQALADAYLAKNGRKGLYKYLHSMGVSTDNLSSGSSGWHQGARTSHEFGVKTSPGTDIASGLHASPGHTLEDGLGASTSREFEVKQSPTGGRIDDRSNQKIMRGYQGARTSREFGVKQNPRRF